MSIFEKLRMSSEITNMMILSTKIERDYSSVLEYFKFLLKQEGRIILIGDKTCLNKFLDDVNKSKMNLDEPIRLKKIKIIESEKLIKDKNLLLKIKEESLELGYKSIAALGISNVDIYETINIIDSMYKAGYEYCCYHNVIDIEVENLFKIDKYYDVVLFEDEDTIEIYNNNTIKELGLILQSIQSSVKSKKNTYDNIKKLEQLNVILTSVSKLSSLDEFLRNFLEFLINITKVSKGGILTKSENKKFEILYNIGGYGEEENNENCITLGESELLKEVYLEDKVVVFLNVNEFTIMYLAFDNEKSVIENKGVLEVAIASARNVVNVFLEKIKNESILIQNEKLKALGEISSGIAHDFNNILATISGYVSLSLAKNHDVTVKEYLEIIRRSSLDGAEMLRRIQEFTKDIKYEDAHCFHLDEILTMALNMINPKISEKRICGVNICISKDLKGVGHVKGREFEIREVIINILNNAIDAMPYGGNVYVRSYNEEDKVVVEIEDTGLGIKNNILARIFDPFFSTKGINGNGIGLSVSYKIIKDHNGDIEVESLDGVGTKFTFKLPVEEEYEVNVFCDIQDYRKRDFKVLVVDDKIWVAKATGEILKSMVTDVDICFSAKEALYKLSLNKYDLIISDLAMPNLNGLELAKQVKEEYPQIKFVIMTGWLGDIEEYNSDIIDHMLEKPFGIEEIKELIERFNTNYK